MIKKRRFKSPRVLLEYLLIFIILSASIYFVRSDFFSIRFFDCKKDGFICLSSDLVLFNSLLAKNIIFTDTNKISESLLLKKIQFKQIIIKKKLPNRLSIDIISRKPAAQYLVKNEAYFIDETGFIFSPVYQIKEKIPTIIAWELESAILGNHASSNAQKALKLAGILDYAYLPFKTLTITKNGDILVSGSGWEALTSSNKNFDQQVSSLQLILRSSTIAQDGVDSNKVRVQKIDLRFEKPVVSSIYE